MPLAVTHVILTIVLVDLFRDYIMKNHKKYLTLHTLLVAGVAGLIPDIDMPIQMLMRLLGANIPLLQHGGMFHTPLFGLVFLIPAIILWNKKKHKAATIFFVITFGILFHIFLDWLLGGGAHTGIMLLWPFTTMSFKVHLLLKLNLGDIPASIDALILIAWLWHEEVKHKIRDFI